MTQLEAIIDLPSILDAILQALFRNTEPRAALTILTRTSKSFSRSISKLVLVKLNSGNTNATLKEAYQQKKVNQFIFNNTWEQFEDFIRLLTQHNGAKNTRKLFRNNLLHAVTEASTEFVSSLLKLQISGAAVQFPARYIIKSLEYAIRNKKNDLALELLPHLKKCFHESEPEHFARIERAVKNNEDLNTEGDVFNLIGRNLKSSFVLLQLLSDRKIVVPGGKLLILEGLVNNERFYYSSSLRWRSSDYYIGTRWLFGARVFPNIDISYFDIKGRRKQVRISQINQSHEVDQKIEYTYEDITTSNIYELVVKTSLGTQFLRSFPYQFVAVTDQALDLPFEEQPWFFGNISHEEAKNIVWGSASNIFFLTVSYGANITVYWSEPKRRSHYDVFKFRLHDTNELKSYIESAVKDLNPVLGFHNGGAPKNFDVCSFRFHRLLANDTLHDIRNRAALFLQENELEISTLCNPSPLWTYLQRKNLDGNDIEWLIENKVYLHGDERPSIMSQMISKKGVESAKILVNLGVKCGTSELLELLEKTPSREEFKLFFDAKTNTIDYNIVLSKLFEVAGIYENERRDALGSGSGEKRTLILLAWRFGNDDNLFKALPIEILQSIFQYDIDVPYWYSIGEMIINAAPRQSIRFKLRSIESVLFVAKYRHLFTAADKAMEEYFDECGNFSRKLPTILRQLKKMDPSLVIKRGANRVVQYCISQSDPNLLRAVLETKIFGSIVLHNLPTSEGKLYYY